MMYVCLIINKWYEENPQGNIVGQNSEVSCVTNVADNSENHPVSLPYAG